MISAALHRIAGFFFFGSRCAALLARYPAFSSPDTPLSAGLQATKYNLSCKLGVGYDQNPSYFVYKSANLEHDIICNNSFEKERRRR